MSGARAARPSNSQDNDYASREDTQSASLIGYEPNMAWSLALRREEYHQEALWRLLEGLLRTIQCDVDAAGGLKLKEGFDSIIRGTNAGEDAQERTWRTMARGQLQTMVRASPSGQRSFRLLKTLQASGAGESGSRDISCPDADSEVPDPWRKMASTRRQTMVRTSHSDEPFALLRGIQEIGEAASGRGDIRCTDADFDDSAWRGPNIGPANGLMEPAPSGQTMGLTGPEPSSQTVSGLGVQGFGQNPRSPTAETVGNLGKLGKTPGAQAYDDKKKICHARLA
jgi:hypothetical protein